MKSIISSACHPYKVQTLISLQNTQRVKRARALDDWMSVFKYILYLLHALSSVLLVTVSIHCCRHRRGSWVLSSCWAQCCSAKCAYRLCSFVVSIPFFVFFILCYSDSFRSLFQRLPLKSPHLSTPKNSLNTNERLDTLSTQEQQCSWQLTIGERQANAMNGSKNYCYP